MFCVSLGIVPCEGESEPLSMCHTKATLVLIKGGTHLAQIVQTHTHSACLVHVHTSAYTTCRRKHKSTHSHRRHTETAGMEITASSTEHICTSINRD